MTEKWGDDAPEWLIVLAEACDRTSQNAVAKRLDYSGSVVSSVINRSYNGNLATVEQAVRGLLLAETLICPVLQKINKKDCLGHQKRARQRLATSSWRVAITRACRNGCIHSHLTKPQGD